MVSIESVKKKITTTEDLQSVVKTMKALAAINIRQYEKAVESLAEYNRTIEMGLQIALKMRPEGAVTVKPAPKQRLGAIVFGSDYGMCGQLNEQIVSHALGIMKELEIRPENRAMLAIGLRAGGHLEDAGQHVEESLPVPGSKAGITSVSYTHLTLPTKA